MIEHNYKTRVYYRDTDLMGIVYYTRYLEYFEAARTELLRSIGLDVRAIEEMGYFMPVISVNCEYKIPATFDDKLFVKTTIKAIPRSYLIIEYEIFKDDNNLVVRGDTKHAFTNENGKPVKPPIKLIDTLKLKI